MKESAEAMNRMVEAMESISASSQNISVIIKVIDDIAFQTNILALNAAVEAARAGQHGKGFAVVSDEVRNLAAKSAVAAKDTAALISDSVEQVQVGEEIVKQVGEYLNSISEYAEKTSSLIEDINDSSQFQSQALLDITGGIHQITSVVQSNSAVAEQTAASSEQMAAQSSMLRDTLRIYRVKEETDEPVEREEAAAENRSAPPVNYSDSVAAFAVNPSSMKSGMMLVKGNRSKY